MPKKTILHIMHDVQSDLITMQVTSNMVELAAHLCAMMEQDERFKISLYMAAKVFSEKAFSAPKPFAEA